MEKSLASFLDRHRGELIEGWRQRVTGPLNPEHTPRSEILDSLPVFLDEMIGKLLEGNGAEVRPSATAPGHGAQRYHAGFSLGAVIREYRAFQDCIFDLLQKHDHEATLPELQRALSCVTSAIADACQEFTKERDTAFAQQKDEHLAFMAHELRNPLSSARLAVDLLRKTLPMPHPPALHRVLRNLDRVQGLIDHAVLEVRVRSVSREFRLFKERLSLNEVIHEVAQETAGDAEGKDIAVTVHADAAAFVEADKRLIYSAVTNLVRNALKFTPPQGEVQVRLHVAEGRASVEVEDRCGGLPQGKVEELFTPFVQKGADRTGFGLGLAITKQAIEAHGGTIQVRSLPGTGCVFMFDLPVAVDGTADVQDA